MQTTSRVRDTGPSFAARQRGHTPHISIDDDDHHVTEAIGHMYGGDVGADGRKRGSGTSHYTASLQGNGLPIKDTSEKADLIPRKNSIPRKQVPDRKMSNGETGSRPNGQVKLPQASDSNWELHSGSSSPPLGLRGRSPSETATSPFPLNDIDYESSPAAVAQELSNLQALRRMSMDVAAAAGDPDLPLLNPATMPASPSLSEDDSSRLFWVPARLHPELAPKEFKTFLESKAEQIRRRSGELSAFATPSAVRGGSLAVGDKSAGLRRKKSMLSRQINSSVGYQDGAERLERKKSASQRMGHNDPNLEELEELVANGPRLPRLSSEGSAEEENGDVILPSIPGSNLKRSTRTTYKRGGSVNVRSERLPYAERAARRAAAVVGEESPSTAPSLPALPPLPTFPSTDFSGLTQSSKGDDSFDSIQAKSSLNFSRPAGPTASSQPSASGTSTSSIFDLPPVSDDLSRLSLSSAPEIKNWRAEPPSQGRPSLNLPSDRQAIPQIVAIPPPEEPSTQPRPSITVTPSPKPLPASQQQMRLPERTSSREEAIKVKTAAPQRPTLPPKQSSVVLKRPPSRGSPTPSQSKSLSLDQMSSHPAPLPGNDTNTSTLSFIPTLTEDKRADNKKVKDKKGDSKKSGWGWLVGKEEVEKDRAKSKSPKSSEKHDNTRLDVLQSSIDGGAKGRESIVLDRDSLKLEEERKKESQRKSASSDTKKEKEGLFSSFFGGKKNKAEKDIPQKKAAINRGLSPEPPYRELKPDIDYNWTRFSILEERAIYRMAHIKLANPRRALYSQVLLSNFMYSYLAKVQQMHPQMNLPTSAKQQRRQQKEQPDEFTQYQRYQQQQQQQEQQEQLAHQQQQQQQLQQQQSHQSYSSNQGYDGDSSMYDYENSGNGRRPTSRGSKSGGESSSGYSGTGGGYSNQYSRSNSSQHDAYGHSAPDDDDDDDDDIW